MEIVGIIVGSSIWAILLLVMVWDRLPWTHRDDTVAATVSAGVNAGRLCPWCTHDRHDGAVCGELLDAAGWGRDSTCPCCYRP